MRTQLIFLFILIFKLSFAQNEKAFIIYKSNGKKATYKEMKKLAEQQEIVFFGEHHDNPIAHWLELGLTKDLFVKHQSNLQLAFEMFEQDQQVILDKYVNGSLTEKQFADSCRLWPNYETDYRPIVDFAKEHKLKCVASNIQRKYASLLFKKGRTALDTLSLLIKSQMAEVNFPIDTTLSQYREIRAMGGEHMGINMIEAQAIKDATMAKFILANRNSNTKTIHYNGTFHSDYKQGILWYIWKQNPNLKIMTISTVTQENINKLDKENLNKADFIICVPDSMTRTH
ncbi:MAG: iron-regulated protein [Crocinitomicaceae bacterium]|nr:iron-regulated protein [Crocinitomicaceae bacterium]